MQVKDSFYLNKYAFKPPQLKDLASKLTGIIVTIPCHNEPNLVSSLQALWNCNSPNCDVEVIVVINASETADEKIKSRNTSSYKEAKVWAENHLGEGIKFFFILENDLPKKHAGVGLARKIAMDEASWRFESIGKMDGIIACFDADSHCDNNYLIELENHFNLHPKSPGCAIRYEHPVSGIEFSEEIYAGIIAYELHLRYYRQAIKYTGHPAAYHTVGSSMAVRALAYQKQGGMNKRKAGEDFYFLQKIIALGGFTELNSTRIIPSPRPSERVPFGTGRAIEEWIENQQSIYMSYNFKSFILLKEFFGLIESFYDSKSNYQSLSEEMKGFIEDKEFENKLNELRRQSTNVNRFIQRFFFWFDAFKILKFVHFIRDKHLPNESVVSQCKLLMEKLDLTTTPEGSSPYKYLEIFRKIDRNVL